MDSRRLLAASILVLAASGWGCTLMDRESYSLVIRKPAHRYEPQEPRPEPQALPADWVVLDAVSECSLPDPSTFTRRDLDSLVDHLAPPGMEAFRPFAYCYHHDSSHALESLFAVVLAPFEYSTALTGNIASQRVLLFWPDQPAPGAAAPPPDLAPKKTTPTR